ncbi:Cytochrome C (plasmid) [Cupriavidus necator H16]|uniref:Uncharacterized protein n=1 Tax=Cupriavidus necator (strain ATCC 17699 / DSM 428 / KCTC 22496 / NCIMB 10442 / H16 / Stanier 337) TaxID=381666 RepID=Q7WWW4_CUPNH|nr:hypothetical protein [Cupriavidus necator]AAP86127.1 hypothetical protein PHG378 [Cupriavidus necator H16]QCC05596.1 hypothetical protein E6A55_34145 [Cupriavidus necator H16]QQB81416.1 hypothetical protein I6H87_34075 [Cupriavidus necator]
MQRLQLVISPAHFVDRFGRRVLTNAGQPGMDGKEGVGSTTEEQRNRVAAAIYANCEHLDNAQLDEIVAWVRLYRKK